MPTYRWVRALKAVAARKELPRPRWMTFARFDRKAWELTLECGHTVQRVSYDSKPLPKRCECRTCMVLKEYP